MRKLLLTFFKGGSSTEQVRKRDPEPQELTDLRNQINLMLSPLMGGAKPEGWDNTDFGRGYNETGKRKDAALGYYDETSRALKDKAIGGVKDFGYLSDLGRNLVTNGPKDYEQLSDTMRDVSTTGVIPQAITDNMNYSIMRALDKSMGSNLNDMGNRGVINSSVMNRSVNAMSDSAADAYSKNYLSAYDSVLGGLANTINTNKGVFDSRSAAINNQINANKGVYDSEVQGLNTATNTFLDAPTKLWQGFQQQFNPAYTFWKDWQGSYDGKEDYDTVVHQGK